MSEPHGPTTPSLLASAGSAARSGLGVLVLTLVLPFPLFAGVGFWLYGVPGVVSAAVTGGCCLIAGMASFLVSRLFVGPQATNGVLCGMVVRMVLPLALAATLLSTRSPLLKAGVLGMLIVYYLLSLCTETILAVRTVNMSSGVRKVD